MCDSCGCKNNAIGLGQAAGHDGRPQDKFGKYDGIGGTNNPGNSK